MKKIVLTLLALLTISLSACSQKKTDTKMEQKVLVAYFSATGTTKAAARQLAEVAGADLYEIKPEQPYTDADLDWNDKQSRSSVEMQDKHSRPAMTIINTFLETYDFKDKTVIPFATSGGSSIKKACADLEAAYPEINWKEGKLLNHTSKGDLLKWVERNR